MQKRFQSCQSFEKEKYRKPAILIESDTDNCNSSPFGKIWQRPLNLALNCSHPQPQGENYLKERERGRNKRMSCIR
ncbi:hypothetical protein SUGI_0854580 [Cryptomeria japonica]|nr:hypothetical protein SUGI_0854580 [Cryptomeria japonica]